MAQNKGLYHRRSSSGITINNKHHNNKIKGNCKEGFIALLYLEENNVK